MFKDDYPCFENGRILKLEMLQALRDYPRTIVDVFLQEYSDGIFMGCEIQVTDDYLIVQPGLISYQKKLYRLDEPLYIDYSANNILTILKIQFFGEETTGDFKNLTTKVYCDTEANLKENEMEIGRFKLREGSRLRNKPINFQDLTTEFDLFNRVHTPYAAKRESTIALEILELFAQEASSYTLSSPYDIQFIMMIHNAHLPIKRKVILHYISTKLKANDINASNFEIYKALERILKELKNNKPEQITKSYNKRLLVE